MKMRGEGGLRHRSQLRTWSSNRTLNGCERKKNLDNVVLIDVDSERLDNVIMIDDPDSLQHKIGGSDILRKGKRIQFGGIISIDDDEDVGCSEMESDSSPSRSCPARNHTNKSEDLGDDDCWVVKEKNFAFRASKRKQASGKDPCTHSNRYGFYDSGSSDSDGSDCEVMEGSFGNKVWEKAFLKRKSNVHQGNSGVGDQASPSSLNEDDPRPDFDVEVGERTEVHSNNSFFCNWSNGSHKKQKFSPSVPTDDRESDNASLDPGSGMLRPSVQSDKKVELEEKSSPKEADFQFRGVSSSWWQSCKHNHDGSGSSFFDRLSRQRQYFWYSKEEGDKQYHHTSERDDKNTSWQGVNQKFHHKNTSFRDNEASLCKSQQSNDSCNNTEQVGPCEKYEEFPQATSSCSSAPGKSQNLRTVFIEKVKPIPRDPPSNSQPSSGKKAKCGVTPSECNAGASFEEYFSSKIPSSGMPEVCNEKSGQPDAKKPYSKGVSSCGIPSSGTPEVCNEKSGQPNAEKPYSEGVSSFEIPSSGTPEVCNEKSGLPDAEKPYSEGASLCEIPSSGMPEVSNEKSGQPDAEKPYSEGFSSCEIQCADRQSKQKSPCSTKPKQLVTGSISNNQLNGGTDPGHTQGVSLPSASPGDIINEREKLKETDEYKQAMEEEWASRQRELQIQAEEAQRLRKKKRAESMRLLDMERRQKQRLEEIRETLKKDEENMNLKEKLRVEVRKELYKLETTCIDMASLLRALGIHVGGNFRPLSQEVHAAYKQALLRFHPDRASKTDVRQQVEAEEKFKLISRMKEKFLLTTCH